MVVFGMSSVSAAEINDAGDQGTLSEDEKGTVNDEMSEYPERPGDIGDVEDIGDVGTSGGAGVALEPDDVEEDKGMIPETEDSSEPDSESKEECIGIDGLEEPNEMAQYSRAATIPGRWIQEADGRWWYRHNNGTYTRNGWEYINDAWYYFDSAGWMVTGWIQLGGTWYYLRPSGAMATGWLQLSAGTWYYLNSSGAMMTSWVLIGSKWFYFNASGVMQTGWIQLEGKWYYLNLAGEMMTGWVWANGNHRYYCDESGVMQTGWLYNRGKWYYLKPSGEAATSWELINGKYYLFDNMGAMYAGRIKADNLDEDSKRTIYFDGSGAWLYTVSLNSFWLADSGKHLDWGGKTKYDSYVPDAARVWNSHKSGIIQKDTVIARQDVVFRDIKEESKVLGVTKLKERSIELNTYRMDKASDNVRLSVIIHEFGHALGLGHNDPADVMYEENRGVIELTTSDKKSYDAAYERY